jgi:uncharacterized protein
VAGGVLDAVHAHVAAFNARDLEAILGHFAEDALFATGEHLVVGRRGLRQVFSDAFAIPATLRLEVLRAVVEGDTAACELRETITAAGVTHEFPIAAFYTVRGGELVRVKVYREGAAETPV